jgi:hypothetical protein
MIQKPDDRAGGKGSRPPMCHLCTDFRIAEYLLRNVVGQVLHLIKFRQGVRDSDCCPDHWV